MHIWGEKVKYGIRLFMIQASKLELQCTKLMLINRTATHPTANRGRIVGVPIHTQILFLGYSTNNHTPPAVWPRRTSLSAIIYPSTNN